MGMSLGSWSAKQVGKEWRRTSLVDKKLCLQSTNTLSQVTCQCQGISMEQSLSMRDYTYLEGQWVNQEAPENEEDWGSRSVSQ